MSELLTIQEISQETGLSRGIVWRAIRLDKLKLSKTVRPFMVADLDLQDWLQTLLPPISKEDLDRMYVSERKSITQISKDTGLSRMVIHRLLKSYGILRRTQSEAMKGINTWGTDPVKNAARAKKAGAGHRGKKIHVSEQDRERRRKQTTERNKLPWSEEFTIKQSLAHAGEKNYRWCGGSDHYRGKNWQRQRRKARQRDNFTCQRCGTTETELGQELDVHHISKYREFDNHVSANKLNNLISYCKACHGVVERELERKLNSD